MRPRRQERLQQLVARGGPLGIGAIGGALMVLMAKAWAHARSSMFRLQLLDRVGRIADGSLPLAETLERVTELVVPSYTDLCMIDAIRDGDVRRIAVRAHGEDSEAIERHIAARTPSTPDWLRTPDGSLEPQFVPAMPDEVLREMANDSEDLAFLRRLRANSYIVAPLVSRGRSLGTLTIVRLRRSPRLSRDDMRFVAALATRIGMALDNAGLFSDLESIERRMDTVMETVTEAVIVHDAGGNLVYSNEAASRLPGFEGLQEIVYESAQKGGSTGSHGELEMRDEEGQLLDPAALPRRRALLGEQPEPLVFGVYDPQTGQVSWRLERSSAIRGADGQPLYAVTTVEDVTAVKRAEFEQRLLADAAESVSAAADYEAALEALACTVVPRLADWCSVNVPDDDGAIAQVAVSERDPQMIDVAARLREGLLLASGREFGMADVLRAGKPMIAELPAQPLPGWALLKPIRAGSEVSGVMCLVNRAARHAFSPADVRLARQLADRAGIAILNAKLAEERAQIAEALQRELLPPMLPEVAGWSMAAMYRPAGSQNRAGGDFYDAFEGRTGWVVVLGDVEGHGAEAAALTAMVRYTIRTAAMIDGDLLGALEIINAELRRRPDPRLCSVVCVTFGAREEAMVVSAGHPLPLLISAGTISEVGLPGSLLGALEDPQWSQVRFAIEPGEELVVYTDGVVEAKRDGERFGRERLGALLRGASTPGDAVRQIGEAIDEFTATIQDDAALVLLRREAPEATNRLETAESALQSIE